MFKLMAPFLLLLCSYPAAADTLVAIRKGDYAVLENMSDPKNLVPGQTYGGEANTIVSSPPGPGECWLPPGKVQIEGSSDKGVYFKRIEEELKYYSSVDTGSLAYPLPKNICQHSYTLFLTHENFQKHARRTSAGDSPQQPSEGVLPLLKKPLAPRK